MPCCNWAKPGPAEKALRRATELAPDNAEFLNNHGTALRRLERNAEAASMFERAIQGDAKFIAAWGNLADARYAAGQLAEAERVCAAVVERQADYPGVQYTLGQINFIRGTYEPARTALAAFVAARPDELKGHLLLGQILSVTGSTGGALTHFEQARAIDPDHAGTPPRAG